MTLTSLAIVALALMTFVGFVRLRRVTRRLDRLAESYWQLRYEQGQVTARLSRLEKGVNIAEAPEAPAERPQTAFVPLSSLKKP